VPSFFQFVKNAASVLKGRNVQASKIFITLRCGRAAWGIFLLALFSVFIPNTGSAPGLRQAAVDLFGTSGAVTFWAGILVGYGLILFLAWVYLWPVLKWIWRTRNEGERKLLSPETKRNMVIGLIIIVAVVALYYLIPGVREWTENGIRIISGNPAGVAAYLRGFGAIGPIVSALLMVLQSVLAPLPAFVITFANGMIWGWLWGAVLSWSSAMAGAALCFWIARTFGRPVVEKLAGGSAAIEVSDLFFERYGNRTVLIARLLPFVSFDLISYGAGLTDMKFWPFFIATGIGQLPATIVYSYLASVGGAATSVKTLLYVFIGTAVLLVIASAFREPFMRRLRKKNQPDT
jgi:uncharacterized membrane protein YdjX (TVP38/TMEM64 family)